MILPLFLSCVLTAGLGLIFVNTKVDTNDKPVTRKAIRWYNHFGRMLIVLSILGMFVCGYIYAWSLV
jgi:Ni/Fe-hydrogenase subunit HybB-like protein